MIIGNKEFDTNNKTYICAILNITPDSFSDGGKFTGMDAALSHVEQMLLDGADIIDVGGMSTRPGHINISDQEEIERVCPVIEAIKGRFDIPVSIDTYKSQVFFHAKKAGADMLNDIWGLRKDEKMAQLVAKSGASICLMHNEDSDKYCNSTLEKAMEIIISGIDKSLKIARKSGIEENKICIDPGIGFAKTQRVNLSVLNNIESFKNMGFPVLIGASRKSVIGNVLGLEVENRLYGTLATTVAAVIKGASFVRVHDVKENLQVIKMTKAILETEKQYG